MYGETSTPTLWFLLCLLHVGLTTPLTLVSSVDGGACWGTPCLQGAPEHNHIGSVESQGDTEELLAFLFSGWSSTECMWSPWSFVTGSTVCCSTMLRGSHHARPSFRGLCICCQSDCSVLAPNHQKTFALRAWFTQSEEGCNLHSSLWKTFFDSGL